MRKTLPAFSLGLALTTTVLLTGCNDPQPARPVTESDVQSHDDHGHDHEHHHVAPHDGHLIELGDHKFNVEVTFNDETKEVMLYVLGPHAQTPVAIKPEQLVFEVMDGETPVVQTLVPVEPGETSSTFKVEANDLLKKLETIEDMQAKATLTMGETTLSAALSHEHGTFHEHEGEEHDHDHEHEHEHEEK